MLFEVADTGIGIPQVEIANVVEPFYHLTTPLSPDQDSSGLGLSLVKRLEESPWRRAQHRQRRRQRHGGKLQIPALADSGGGRIERGTFGLAEIVRQRGCEVGADALEDGGAFGVFEGMAGDGLVERDVFL
ncbi:MAG TPA: HAMP domain-containing histidine kinase [Alphaproteobacteria bacterium]|nr:HAMP domain-containing histidine kinase [Alphaproteobacteria bacterium]